MFFPSRFLLRASAGFLAIGLSMAMTPRAHAQGNGSLNPVFGGSSLGFLGDVRSIVLQADGKVLVVGGNTPLTRLNTDGTTDGSFTVAGDNTGVAAAVQADGKIVLAYLPNTRRSATYVTRLNTDGTVDATFSPVATADGDEGVTSVLVQGDGKILVGGNFSTLNGQACGAVARLNADGTLDTSFANGFQAGESDYVGAMVLQPDGKIVVGGTFYTTLAASGLASLYRFNANGSVDTGFNTSTDSTYIESMVLQPDGKILIGGVFTMVNGIARSDLARLNTDGSTDTTFNPASSFYGGPMVLQPDGRLLVIAGSLFRLNSDGTTDASLNVTFTESATDVGATLALQPDGRILVGGSFSAVDGVSRSSLARLNVDGAVDTTFVPDVASGPNAQVIKVAAQPDGKVVVAGYFTRIGGTVANYLGRMNADGLTDLTFQISGAPTPESLTVLAAQPDGKIILSGVFSTINGVACGNIVRLNTDGSVDTGFKAALTDAAGTLAFQPDGKILLTGTLTQAGASASGVLIRLNADGTQDASFSATGLTQSPASVAVQADGKILAYYYHKSAIRGSAATYNLCRLNAEGSADASFPTVYSLTPGGHLLVQPDGKILLYGGYMPSSGYATYLDVRFNTDGTVDTSYAPTVAGIINCMLVQADGTIIIGGDFTQVNGVARGNFARLRPDGSLEPFSNVDSGTDHAIASMDFLADGGVALGGAFTTFNGRLRNYVACLKSTSVPDFFAGQVPVGGGFYYEQFPGGNPFGYYNVEGNGYSFPYFFHADLGIEYFFDADDGYGGAYLYDFTSGTFFYTSPVFPFPYLYDFSLNTVLYYYPDPNNPGHYNTDGFRFFYRYDTGQVIVK